MNVFDTKTDQRPVTVHAPEIGTNHVAEAVRELHDPVIWMRSGHVMIVGGRGFVSSSGELIPRREFIRFEGLFEFGLEVTAGGA